MPSVSSDKLVQTWRSNPMQFWQNQFNFAVWCATIGCGVSLEDHLSAADGLLQSVYRFHVYYQIRRILVEIKVPLPQDQAWDAVNNPYDRRGYERICHEFGVSPHSDWKVSGPNQGLGRVYNYSSYIGYHPFADGEYDSSDMSFTQTTTNSVLHVDFIKQDAAGAGRSWKTFILNKSNGFTHPGVERLNDLRMGCPRRPVPDPYRHHRFRYSLRCAKAVLSRCRGCYLIPCGPPLSNKPLPGCPTVCSLRGQLLIWYGPIHGPEQHASSRR